MIKLSTLTLAITFLSLNVMAQTHLISGAVTDREHHPVELAYISLLNRQDSSLLQTVQTGEDGKFEYPAVKDGSYILRTQALGYHTLMTPVSVSGDTKLATIIMESTGTRMDELTITGRKKMIETELGKTSLNISKEMKQGRSLLDILRNLPGVMVDGNGNISVNGKDGLLVLINEKPTYLSGRELSEYLQGIAAEQVTKVEVMTQPHAKYDAEGNTGIINVRMERTRDQVWSGTASGRYNQAFYPFVGTNSNLTYNKGKYSLNLNPGYYRGVGSLTTTTQKTLATNGNLTQVDEKLIQKEVFSDYSLGAGIDCDAGKKTKLGIGARAVYHPNRELDKSYTRFTDQEGDPMLYNNTRHATGFIRTHQRGNAYLVQTIDSNNELQFNADYFATDRMLTQDVTNDNFDRYGNPVPGGQALKNYIPDATRLYTAKADYTGKLEGIKVEAGAKLSYATVDQENKFFIPSGGHLVNDSTRTNHFLYTENINSGYASCSGSKGKFSTLAGLRLEQTHVQGNQVTQNTQFVQDYVAVVPNLATACKVDSNNTIEASYTRRMHRPGYHELNPFIWFTSQYSYRTGNPMLGPQYTNNIECKYNHRGRFIFTASRSIVNGVYTDELFFEPATNTTRSTVTNNGYSKRDALSAFYNGELSDWLRLSVTCEGHYSRFWGKYNGRDIYNTGSGYYLGIDTEFNLQQGWHAGIHARYASRYRVGILKSVGGSVSMDAQVSRSFFKDTLNMNLSINDPFNLYRYVQLYDFDGVQVQSSGLFNSKGARIALSYNFGRQDKAQRNSRQDDERRI